MGFALGLGASLAWLAVQTVMRVSSMLTLLLLAVFIAISLEPLVVWFTRRGLRRGWAVAIVLTGYIVVVLGGFLALVIPPVTKEITALVDAVPGWLEQLHDHQSTISRLGTASTWSRRPRNRSVQEAEPPALQEASWALARWS
ncbi:AI-2E family transporter [Streptomyces sp. NBC_01450]|uniref:AI-2E family transporter n=1 Tax=Streptomyces sp. NBC_01450 TaxID=2903871 RepID=UPI002E31B589|nr:AI-2E family transporter [Streptomyces sp. NBC_01450]